MDTLLLVIIFLGVLVLISRPRPIKERILIKNKDYRKNKRNR